MGRQRLAPLGPFPGPSRAHGLVQAPLLEGQDSLGLLAGGRQLLLGGLDELLVLTHPGGGQGGVGLSVGVGQRDLELRGQAPGQLPDPVGQVQEAVVVESCRRYGPVGELVIAPSALLGNRPGEVACGGLNAPHLVPPRDAQKHMQRLVAGVGVQAVDQRVELGAPTGVVPHEGAHEGRQLPAVHTHREGEQALAGHGRSQVLALVACEGGGDPRLQRHCRLLLGLLEEARLSGALPAPSQPGLRPVVLLPPHLVRVFPAVLHRGVTGVLGRPGTGDVGG